MFLQTPYMVYDNERPLLLRQKWGVIEKLTYQVIIPKWALWGMINRVFGIDALQRGAVIKMFILQSLW